eukprot:Plantae.Rhodophyta-Rhodochaete_pulchella.ctg11594.p1 GENE.Plantae.Rhodophyta-Rhodochaete_pulchella.ctg11594~~Plantae.Rhodophyta-Rhodochaete_pulchella.ctg11594.p1  ORF type:complete len:496 (-),score=73.03 Plantae.Rhodophyta-Rhodochaete_pulchella.ctg11594:513-1958(-)
MDNQSLRPTKLPQLFSPDAGGLPTSLDHFSFHLDGGKLASTLSLVCFPFKEEKLDIVITNIREAAGHTRVGQVLCVGFSDTNSPTWDAIAAEREAIEKDTGIRVVLRKQERLGNCRPGKGDGMNTALKYFLEETTFARIHFYDADIRSFSAEWISRAETGLDEGYDVVRHYFARSSTDGMITWLITKVAFAKLWPRSILPNIEQPLGGELLLTRKAAKICIEDPRVKARSDWGIDTLYTFVLVQENLPVIEIYSREGKLHALYGGLRDIRNMVLECFHAVQSLRGEAAPAGGVHRIASAEPAPAQVTEKVGYSIEKSMRLLGDNWTPMQEELLRKHFPEYIAVGMIRNKDWPNFDFMDEEAWLDAYDVLLEHFDIENEDWKEILFKSWVARVLNHTVNYCVRGYGVAMTRLHRYIEEVQHRFTMVEKKLMAEQGLDKDPQTANLSGLVFGSSSSTADGLAHDGTRVKNRRREGEYLPNSFV